MTIFTGKHVEITGVVVAIASAVAFLRGGHLAGVLVAFSIYLLDRFYPAAFNWLKDFAEPTAWPGYVALGVAALFAGHFGGWRGDLVIAGIFTAGDGRLFDALY